MFAAQSGILAWYQDRSGHDDTESPLRSRSVVAFTDAGEPMVIGDAELDENQRLVRADSYSGYVGMAHSPRGYDDTRGANSSLTPTPWEIAAVEFAALRGLELAGKRLLTRDSRKWRDTLKDVPAWELHVWLPIHNVDRALESAYDLLHACLPNQQEIYKTIDNYVRERLATRTPHSRVRLLTMLAESGCLRTSGDS